MAQAQDEFEETPAIRRLRRLVTALTVVLMVGVLAIAATIVIRLGILGGPGFAPLEAASFDLPPDREIVAIGRGEGTMLFLLRAPDGAETLHAFDQRTGDPAGTSAVTRGGG